MTHVASRFIRQPHIVCAWAMLAATSIAQAAPKVATITMLDGPAWVMHAPSRLVAPEGVALNAEDIIETAPTTSLMRLELEDGTVVDVGPASRVMVSPQWGASASSAVYVLEGWAKVASPQPASRNRTCLSTASLDVTRMERDVVVRVQGNDVELFAESGEVTIQVRGKGTAGTPLKVARGQFLARHGEIAPSVLPRPHPGFIQAVPRPFMDTLPSRLAAFKDKRISLGAATPVTYADTALWLNAEPRVRTRFPARWKALAQDVGFRRGLTAQLSEHPEWGPVLFPEQHASKPAGASSTSNSSARP